jgi:uncharacterized protein YkwD
MIRNIAEQIKVHHRIGHSFFVAGGFLLLLFASFMLPAATSSSEAFGVSEIINLSNASRVQFGSPELQVNATLMNAAQTKAEDMAKKRYFSHYSPDGTSPWNFINDSGYVYAVAGENLAITNESAESVIRGWLSSPSHRENLLSKDYADFGMGMARYGDYEGHKDTTVIVALYAKVGSPLVVTGSEPTNPAGTIAALKPKLLTFSPEIIFVSAVCLIISGGLLELRHLKKLHHQKSY